MNQNFQKQFVIQQHTTPNGVHWDLMLEMNNCLWTWRLNTPPEKITNAPVSAERIQDHPANRIGELMPWAYHAIVGEQKTELEAKNVA